MYYVYLNFDMPRITTGASTPYCLTDRWC